MNIDRSSFLLDSEVWVAGGSLWLHLKRPAQWNKTIQDFSIHNSILHGMKTSLSLRRCAEHNATEFSPSSSLDVWLPPELMRRLPLWPIDHRSLTVLVDCCQRSHAKWLVSLAWILQDFPGLPETLHSVTPLKCWVRWVSHEAWSAHSWLERFKWRK